jgi:hypothetical protein
MRNAFEPLLLYEKGSFYQDRLGTKVGKALKRDPCFVSYNSTLRRSGSARGTRRTDTPLP